MGAETLADRLRHDEAEFRGAVRRLESEERTLARVRLLGGFYLAAGAVTAGAGLLAFVAIAPWGLLSGDLGATAVFGGVASLVALLCFALAAPALAAGYGLRRRRAWARSLAVLLAIVLLPGFPLGTALGVATLALLLPSEIGPLFA